MQPESAVNSIRLFSGFTRGSIRLIARGNRMPSQAEIDFQSMSTAGPDGTVVRAYVTYLPEVMDRDDLDELIQHWMLALRALAERAAR